MRCSALVPTPSSVSRAAPPRPEPPYDDQRFESRLADVGEDDLAAIFAGADAVVHLAWRFQPTRDPTVTWRSNVIGSERVFAAAAEAGVPALVHASSVGAYAPGRRTSVCRGLR